MDEGANENPNNTIETTNPITISVSDVMTGLIASPGCAGVCTCNRIPAAMNRLCVCVCVCVLHVHTHTHTHAFAFTEGQMEDEWTQGNKGGGRCITCQYAAVRDSHDEADNRTNNNVYDGYKYRNPED